MTLDLAKVSAAVSGGLSIVCATCDLYWAARDKNVPDGKCLSKNGCGSPIAGDVFHEYQGPMTQFDRFCFVCGNSSSHALRVNPYVRVIGVCSEHVDIVKELRPENKRAVSVVLLSPNGERLISEKDLVKPKLSLKIGGE